MRCHVWIATKTKIDQKLISSRPLNAPSKSLGEGGTSRFYITASIPMFKILKNDWRCEDTNLNLTAAFNLFVQGIIHSKFLIRKLQIHIDTSTSKKSRDRLPFTSIVIISFWRLIEIADLEKRISRSYSWFGLMIKNKLFTNFAANLFVHDWHVSMPAHFTSVERVCWY